MSCADEESIVVLEQQWPVTGINCRCDSFWFDGVVGLLAFGKDDRHVLKQRNQAKVLLGSYFLLCDC